VKLNRLVLQNYSVFEGTCELPLGVRSPEKNVIIIGGKNGAGKTSLLEAIRVCLYGAQGIEKRPGREYRAFLQSKINKKALKNSANAKAYVELHFSHEDKSKDRTVLVRRTWTANSDEDTLYLEVDGKELGLERDYWPEFLKLLIPPGVAQFFIFDGEKIQDIAEEERSDGTIVGGIKSLLGLDAFEHVQSDLEQYSRQRLRSEATQATQADYKKADAELEAAKQNYSLCESDSAEVEEEGRSLEVKKLELEKRINVDLGSKFQERPKLQKEKESIDEQLKELNEKFLNMCGELLPFAMLAEVGVELEQALDRERKTANWTAAKEATYPQARKLANQLFGEDSEKTNPELTEGQKQALSSRLLILWESLFVPPPNDILLETMHEMPTTVEGEARRVLRESRGQVANDLRGLLDRRERLANRLRSLDQELNRIPEGDPNEDLFRELANINQTIGRVNEKRSELEDRMEKYRNEINECERRVSQIAELVDAADNARRQLDLCRKIRLVIQDYLDRLTRKKVSTLAKNVEQMIQKLVRKEDLVSKLEIDPKDFSVTLYGRDGAKLKKGDLSAGEKEIYAICLLWGLAKTSERELPIVIDTPLSRLDSDHRKAIVQKYYPSAGPQVIILSTDTEVDKEYYQLLIPSVERAFLLDYDPIQGRTKIVPGYFWK
jgi:DNA sulfur modification protein DndD